MKLESTEKLRKFGLDVCWRIGGWPKHPEDMANEIADEIEREIAERYIKLPVDADGVPIRIGDITTHGNVKTLHFDGELWKFSNENEAVSFAGHTKHVKPRTVEDVLREFGKAYVYVDGECASTSVLISDYADELRDLLGFEIDEPDTIRNELEDNGHIATPYHIGELIIGR